MTSLLSVSGAHHDRVCLTPASSGPVPPRILSVNWRDRGADWHAALVPVGTGGPANDRDEVGTSFGPRNPKSPTFGRVGPSDPRGNEGPAALDPQLRGDREG